MAGEGAPTRGGFFTNTDCPLGRVTAVCSPPRGFCSVWASFPGGGWEGRKSPLCAALPSFSAPRNFVVVAAIPTGGPKAGYFGGPGRLEAWEVLLEESKVSVNWRGFSGCLCPGWYLRKRQQT